MSQSRQITSGLAPDHSRRHFLRQTLAASGVLAVSPQLWAAGDVGGSPRAAVSGDHQPGQSRIPDLSGEMQEITVENDPETRMRVPKGFKVREVARSGQPASSNSDYNWHDAPDGGATFRTEDGGWIYVSNSEIETPRQGGVGALRFDRTGQVIASYPIALGTTNNCAGGPTPWGTWLSCEEIETGLVHECDPTGQRRATAAPAMGMFTHEAAAVDPVGRHIYLTEDQPDGLFYRFTPTHYPRGGRADLSSGVLEALVTDGDDPHSARRVRWAPIPDAMPALGGNAPAPATRHQVSSAERFNGGEGCWYHAGLVYFTTKGDNRMWAYDTRQKTLDLVYDKASAHAFDPGLDDIDNLTVSSGGDVVVAEDGAEMRLVVVGPDVTPFELVNVIGQRGSEITGPAFSPDGSRLYFSSQTGPSNTPDDGRTYEMRGPFFESV